MVEGGSWSIYLGICFMLIFHLDGSFNYALIQDGFKYMNTPKGPILGMVHHTILNRDSVFAFYSIPYANAPIGKLRYKPPEEYGMWGKQKTYDGRRIRSICPQYLDGVKEIEEAYGASISPASVKWPVSEDCLELDVYTPSEHGRLPVMVYIHGGMLYHGTGHNFNGTALSSHGRVVVVSINYRLGFLGFLSNNDNVKGNLGFLDQVLALKWVRDNIKIFGGDPNLVTLFGESAGSFSITAHLVSPLSAGLFKRAICQSGTLLTPGLIHHAPEIDYMQLVKVLNCSTTNKASALKCLRKVHHTKLSIIGHKIRKIHWATIDGVFLPKSLYDLYEEGNFNADRVMLGFNKDEGYSYTGVGGILYDFKYTLILQTAHSIINKWYRPLIFNKTQIVKIVRKYLKDYEENHIGTYEMKKALSDLTGDFIMGFPIIEMAKMIRAKRKLVFQYNFNHSFSFLAKGRSMRNISAHFDELFFVFGVGFLDFWVNKEKGQEFTEEEEKLSLQMMTYWSNFAYKGNPNQDVLPFWPDFTLDKQSYINFSTTSINISSHYRKDIMAFWKDMLDQTTIDSLENSENKDKNANKDTDLRTEL